MIQSKPYESEAVRAVTGPAIRPGGLNLTRRAAKVCRLAAGDRVLDVGCGIGATVDFLNRHFQTRAVGLDLSPVLLAEAKGCDGDRPVIRGNAMDLPVKDRHLSAVYCECVLSLLADPASALDEYRRVLRPGGHVVITDIYRRATDLPPPDPAIGASGCLKGAVDRDVMTQRVAAAGFALCLWEDHSDLLKVLAARLVWAGISIEAFWGADCARNAGTEHQRPGYCLLVARKGK
ncbi:DVU_1556 family methyltransferase [uncultured Desulfosarcina sp.]|uniref:DVU_1556 family methyltransferase n=1 Tax=uncultured Desulfosarcina sp. TaxID=218289 RepID=UPI0029C79753|nr:class I SAM-dependent methyltransferase [uncultured Desulfosarcina sp.]